MISKSRRRGVRDRATNQSTPVFHTLRMDGRIEVSFAFDPGLTDPIARMLVGFSDWYDPIHALAFSLLGPGDRVLDLGAHVGTFALPVAALGCTVLAVEAAAENVALLRRAAERNGLDRISVVQAAVAAAEGNVSFSSDGPLGQAGRARPGASSVSVRAVAVDDLLAERSFGPVDLVKIDVEGSEPQALAGMTGLLDRPDAPPILIESNGHTLGQYGATTHDLRAALGRHGYVCYLIDGSLENRLVPVSAAELQPECVADYLALKTVPTDLAPWFIAPPFGRAELVERVLTMCRHADVDHRRYAAQVLRDAPVWMLAHETVRAAVLELREDPEASVREATADLFANGSAPA